MVRVMNFFNAAHAFARLLGQIVDFASRMVWQLVGWLLTSFATFWRGVPKAVETIANDWLDRAFFAGFPTRYSAQLYRVLYIVAFSTIVVGWVVLSYLTVWIVGLIL